MKLKLVSFKICPFVQRSVITLLEKNTPFDIAYIDLSEPPEWFLEISPFGKVPVLQVNGTVLFESAVINEYLDETHPPSMHPQDPLRKAENRAWIEFGSGINFQQHDVLWAKDQETFENNWQHLQSDLQRLETQLHEGPFFNGEDFSLVDAAYAPPLMRFDLVERYHRFKFLDNFPKLQAWNKQLLGRVSVKNSVVPEFESLYINAIKKAGGYPAQFFA